MWQVVWWRFSLRGRNPAVMSALFLFHQILKRQTFTTDNDLLKSNFEMQIFVFEQWLTVLRLSSVNRQCEWRGRLFKDSCEYKNRFLNLLVNLDWNCLMRFVSCVSTLVTSPYTTPATIDVIQSPAWRHRATGAWQQCVSWCGLVLELCFKLWVRPLLWRCSHLLRSSDRSSKCSDSTASSHQRWLLFVLMLSAYHGTTSPITTSVFQFQHKH